MLEIKLKSVDKNKVSVALKDANNREIEKQNNTGQVLESKSMGYSSLRLGVLSITTERAVNKIPKATIVCEDGDIVGKDFEQSSRDFFNLGNTITITATDSGAAMQFTGVVTKHQISMDSSGGKLIIELRNQASEYTEDRLNKVHTIGEGDNQQTLIQHYCTDWDYWICLADLHSKWIVVQNNSIYIVKPYKTISNQLLRQLFYKQVEFNQIVNVLVTSPIYQLESKNEIIIEYANEDILSYNMSLSGDTHGDIQAELDRFHDVPTKAIEEFAASAGLNDTLRDKWIEAEKTKIKFSNTGSITLLASDQYRDLGILGEGDRQSTIFLGQTIDIARISAKFNNRQLVTSIVHTIDSNGWTITLGYGMTREWHIEKYPNVMKPPALALTPGVHGLMVGVVHERSAADTNRVKVKLYGKEDNAFVINARKAKMSSQAATYPVYEPKTRVLLGFVNDHPDELVVLSVLQGVNNDSLESSWS